MIAEKLPPPGKGGRGSFTASIRYAAGASLSRPAWSHIVGVTSLQTAALEMDAVAAASRCRDPVLHYTLSYAASEIADRALIIRDCATILAAVGMADAQHVIVMHNDTDHAHAHLIANRVGADGRAAALHHDYAKVERSVAKIALERGWHVVAGQWNRDLVAEQGIAKGTPQETSSSSRGKMPDHRFERTGELPWSETVRPEIVAATEAAVSWEDLTARLAAHGITMKHTEKRGGFHGLSFAAGLEKTAPGCAASDISQACSYKHLAQRFGPWSSPTRPTIAPGTVGQGSSAVGRWERSRAASYLVTDNASLRDEYKQFLDGERKAVRDHNQAACEGAWQAELRERARTLDAIYAGRRDMRRLARRSLRRSLIKTLILEILEAAYQWRISAVRKRARERWAAARPSLGLRPRPLNYLGWLDLRAAAGDERARRQLQWLHDRRGGSSSGAIQLSAQPPIGKMRDLPAQATRRRIPERGSFER